MPNAQRPVWSTILFHCISEPCGCVVISIIIDHLMIQKQKAYSVDACSHTVILIL